MKKSRLFGLIHTFTLIGSLLITQSVWAHKYTVCDTDCDFTTIQDAVNYVNWGDTIHILSGTYLEDVTITGKSLNLIGSGKSDTIVNGTGLRPVFLFQCTDASTIINISGLSITGANFDRDADFPFNGSAGGIENIHCGLNVTNVQIHDVSAPLGGLNTNGPTIVNTSDFTNIHGNFANGAISVRNNILTLKHSNVFNNIVGGCHRVPGGAVESRGAGAILNILNSNITDNSTDTPNACGASGVYTDSGGTLIIKNSVVSRNGSAGIHNRGTARIISTIIDSNGIGSGLLNNGVMTIKSSFVINNSGWVDHGGGINNTGNLKIKNSVIANNSIVGPGGGTGGGILNSGKLVLIDTSITENGAPEDADMTTYEGGGIYNEANGTVKVDDHTIIKKNRPDNCGGDVFTCP